MPGPLDITATSPFIEALGTDDDPVIAAVFGVAPNTVRYHRDKRGIPSFRSVRRGAVKHLIKKGLTDSAIQKDTGMDRRAVARLRAKMGAPNPYNVAAQNTREAVLAYHAEDPGASPRKIAEDLDIAHSWVRLLLKKAPG